MAPVLPEKVTVKRANYVVEQVDVTWNSVPAEKYAKGGIFIVEGKVDGLWK